VQYLDVLRSEEEAARAATTTADAAALEREKTVPVAVASAERHGSRRREGVNKKGVQRRLQLGFRSDTHTAVSKKSMFYPGAARACLVEINMSRERCSRENVLGMQSYARFLLH
jgi:hypothetical protein